MTNPTIAPLTDAERIVIRLLSILRAKDEEIASLNAGISAQDAVLTRKYNDQLARANGLESDLAATKAELGRAKEALRKEGT